MNSVKSLYETYSGISSFMNYSTNSSLWYEYKSISLLKKGCLIYTEWDFHLNTDLINSVYGSLYLQKLSPAQQNIDCSLKSKIPFGLFFGAFGIMVDGKIRTVEKVEEGQDLVLQNLHDAHMYVDGGADEYLWSKNPTKIMYDNYMVMGNGISGNIQPYRTEIGSLVTDRMGDEAIEVRAVRNYEEEDVGFRYLGTMNYYDHHHNKENESMSGFERWEYNASTGEFEFEFSDDRVYCEPFEEAEREGYRNHKLYGGNDVQWYSHKEILNGVAEAEGFIDYVPPHYADKAAFRNSCLVENSKEEMDDSGIGGYMITATDGTVYHYALPVYSLNEFTETLTGLAA
jgi:hypothetical protein